MKTLLRNTRTSMAFATVAALTVATGCAATASGSARGRAVSTTQGAPGGTPSLGPLHVAAVGEAVPDFSSQDASRWVNGEPFTIASSRGRVVLVESWHRL